MKSNNNKLPSQDIIIKYNLQKYQMSQLSRFSLGVLGIVSSLHLALTNNLEVTSTINALVILLIFRNLNKGCLPKTKPNPLQLGCTYVVLMIITTFLSYLALEFKEYIRSYSIAVALGITLTLMLYNKLLPRVIMFYYSIKIILACCEESGC